jgi:hypothetical protein
MVFSLPFILGLRLTLAFQRRARLIPVSEIGGR